MVLEIPAAARRPVHNLRSTTESMDRIFMLREVAQADPTDAAAWFLLGRELANAARHAEAADAFRGALRANPDYAAAFRQLGNALEALGRTDEAVATYTQG